MQPSHFRCYCYTFRERTLMDSRTDGSVVDCLVQVTNTLKNVCVPLADNKLLMNNVATAAVGSFLLLLAAFIAGNLVA